MSDRDVSDSLEAALGERCRGRVLHELSALQPFSEDFGGIHCVTPRVVFQPLDVDDLALGLAIAASHGVTITPRGAGHSQAGQSLGPGLLLDLREVGGPPVIADEGETITLGGGNTWREAADVCSSRGRLPCGLTHMLDASVGGTLSVGGIGAEAWRVGPQVDNVHWLEVMTVRGELVKCSREHASPLFDAVRGGLGQFGVIVRAAYPLRRSGGLMRTRFLVYGDAYAFHADVNAIVAASHPLLLAGAVTDDPRGARGKRVLLCIGQEFDEGSAVGEAPLARLHADYELPPRFTRTWTGDGLPGHVFFQTFPRAHRAIHDNAVHPWIDHLLPNAQAAPALASLLARPPAVLEHGRLGVIFVSRATSPAPFFVTPDVTTLNWELGMFSAFGRSERERGLALMTEFAERIEPHGGKRYLSSHAPFSRSSCAEHYGPAWPALRDAKRRFDPAGLLNPGFISWPP